MAQYVQIGVTALRDPKTGAFQPAIPLYIDGNDANLDAQKRLCDDIGQLFAARMKAEAKAEAV